MERTLPRRWTAWYISIKDDGQAVEPSALDAVKKAIKELQNSRNPAGKAELLAELFTKHGNEQLHVLYTVEDFERRSNYQLAGWTALFILRPKKDTEWSASNIDSDDFPAKTESYNAG